MNDMSPLTYTNWNAGEPNNIGNEDTAMMILTDGNSYGGKTRNGLWNDSLAHNHPDEPDRIAYFSNRSFICIKDLDE